MAGERFELAMEPTAIGLGSLNSNSETRMTVICDARLFYGRGGFDGYLNAVQLRKAHDVICPTTLNHTRLCSRTGQAGEVASKPH